MVRERWPDAIYEQLADILRERAGLVFQTMRRAAVETAAMHVMERIGIKAPENFLPLVAQAGAVFDDLMAEVTIGETYFFREPGHFALLRERILPEFKKAAKEQRRFRAWSAAASTGEEPYSIAIALREQGVAGDVIGTDISRARLAAARRATYRRWSFRGVPQSTIDRYFKTESDRTHGEAFTLAPALRRDVELRYLNLASDCYPSMSSGVWGMDVVFCRNVLIYFDRDTIARVAKGLLESITEDGWVLLGATDPPLNEFVRCHVVQTEHGLAYRRKTTGEERRATGDASRVVERYVPPAPRLATPEVAPPITHRPPPVAPPAPPVAPQPTSGIAPAQIPVDPATQAAARVRELANAGRLDEAGRECAAALDVHRESAELHYLHAVLVAQARQFAESARAARRALYLDRSMIVAHAALGTALAKSGDAPGARRAFNNALRLLSAMDPDATVPFSGGEPAGRLLEMTRMQARLVRGDAA